MIEEDTPRSYTSPRDDRFFTPRTIARSGSQSNSDEWVSPRDFQTPRSFPDSDRKDRAYQPNPYASTNAGAKDQYNLHEYYGNQAKQPAYPSDAKGSYNYNNSTAYNNNSQYYSQAKSVPQSSSAVPNSARRQYIAEEEEYQYNGDDAEAQVMQTFLDYELEEIFSFARHGRCEEIEKLLDRGLPVDVRDEFGNTLLIIACQNGNKRVAKSVLRRGANINSRNFKGNTGLHFCYQYGYGESLGQYLISKGADPDARNNAGKFTWQGV